MSKTNPNKNTALAQHQKVIAGIDKYFGKVKTLTVLGTSYTPTALKAVFQADIDATNKVDASRAQWKQQVADSRGARAKARKTRRALRNMLLGNYGEAAVQMLEDFGIPVPKPTGRKTAKTKADAVVKAEATREARHETHSASAAPTQAATPAAGATAAASNTPTHS